MTGRSINPLLYIVVKQRITTIKIVSPGTYIVQITEIDFRTGLARVISAHVIRR